ncbi:hypothetical protein CVT25_013233 [Psilocybe cyanescens]|uniref:Uncharacterized protein n=1 Tax=Psilocybe cyanescens TaxID=93625 RepID=A0A409X0R0_PSICY|nr:hypothetical protein CVT25_013233 [Psilocybe cyanescens]
MGTTKDTVVFLDEIDIITDAGNMMQAQTMKNAEKYKVVVDLEETALRLGLCRISKYTFKWVRVKSFKGDTSPTPNTHSDCPTRAYAVEYCVPPGHIPGRRENCDEDAEAEWRCAFHV